MRLLFNVTFLIFVFGCSSPENRPEPTATDDEETPEAVEGEEETDVEAPAFGEGAEGFDVSGWQAILTQYVTDDGGFRYAALHGDAEDREALGALAGEVGRADPSAWNRDAQLAFYIDAYNIMAVKLVIDRWPIESVMQSDGFFREASHRVAGRDITLDALENEVIRAERFSEPRIHFAVNCASVGCPWLSGAAYTGANLQTQLDQQTASFIRRTTRIDRAANRVEVSQIFEWFADDFGGADRVRAFVSGRLSGEDQAFVREDTTEIVHFEYDWAVNAR